MNDFDVAEKYNPETRQQLNEMQQFYANGLIKLGFEVRFNDLRILHRMGESGIVITNLRSNLKYDGKA